MLPIIQQIICLLLCSISLNSAANIEEELTNKIEDNADTTRNARYVRYQGNPYYYDNADGYYYPNRGGYYPSNQYPGGSTQFYPVDRYPNKLDPNYWLSKIPGFAGSYNPNYPSYQPGYYPQSGYYPGGTNFIGYNGYPSRYPGGYPQPGYPGNGGYGGYQGNGGFASYNGYDGYYAAGNRPGNTGYGYQNSRTNGIIGNRYPNTLLPIATPSTVSKDAK